MQGIAKAAALALMLGCGLALGEDSPPPHEMPSTPAKARPARQPETLDDPLLAPFLAHGNILSMMLSPDGKRIATLLTDGRYAAIGMIDVDTMGMRQIQEPQFVAAGRYVPHVRLPRSVAWVANDLLAVNYNDGAWLAEPDGKQAGTLFAAWRTQLRDEHDEPTDWALVQRDFDDPTHLSKVNIRTHENISADLDVRGPVVRLLPDNRGEIRVVTTADTASWTDHTTPVTRMLDADGHWREIDARSMLADPFVPLQILPGSGHLAVQARNGSDRLAIWEFDPASKVWLRQLAADPSDDVVSEQFVDAQGGVAAVMSGGLKPSFHWFDPAMSRLQASLDASLPGRVNMMLSPVASPRMLVFSYSDIDPGRWYLFEPAAMKMKELLGVIPDVRPERMQPMQMLRYPSFDGTEVPAYLTLPGRPASPAPLIVLIHGGPQARDYWQWDRDVQVFAAHGYAVFQPQFRGSTGFGKKFEEAGYGQWGQAMRDDITAGVHWLIDRKIADPQRICIVGASYGGYAALWGLAHTPDLYKCGVSTAGVSDIGRMLKADSDTNASALGREALRSKVADPARMKVPFDDVSPLKHADRIVAPLLLVHGRLDKRVPISEGQAMLAEMRRLHKDVRWLEFADEGHGVTRGKNLEQWYTAMFALFDRTIGKGLPPDPPLEPAVAPPASAPQ